uniref:NADH dehydrogenase subunit 4L n=1 Tax=Stephanitis chinensis TaxID=2045229 RepID=UPI0022649D04|nr:NADH dehydrogenase subunit 4L [Stephanitis chinensis]UYX61153.1 NADH dehydrogenase subunit 4L [Stephanitis chinensis]
MLMNSLLISYVCGFMVFFSMRVHLLLTLISIEFLMIIIYMMMFNVFMIFGNDLYFLILFLVMLVCEGSLGLSILVCLIRCHGNDMINSLYMLLW